MNTLKCPFCKQPLKRISDDMHMCIWDSLFVSTKSRSCHFGASASKHMVESFRFLDTFRRVRPTFVFSPKKLWEEGFEEKDVKFVNCKRPAENVVNYDITKLSILDDVKRGHLIAGAGMVADDLRLYITHAVIQEAEKSPLDMVEFPEAGKWLWIKTILNSCDIYPNVDALRAVSAYFSVCPEQMYSFVAPNDDFGLSALPFTDEYMLYTHIVAMPSVNIVWDKGAKKMLENCRNFIKFQTRGLKHIEDKKDDWKIDKLPKGMQNEKAFFEVLLPFLKAQPSLAVNMQDQEIVTYDILDNEFKTDPTEGLEGNITAQKVMSSMRADMVLSEMFSKYAAPFLKSCGIEEKVNYCRLNGVSVDSDAWDEVVIKFWEVIRGKLEEDDN